MSVIEKSDYDFYWDNGYLQVPGVLSAAEVEALRAASKRMIDYADAQRVPNPDYLYSWDGNLERHVLTRINYPKKRSVEFAALMGHPRLLEIFEKLLGPDFIVIDDALVFKLPGAGKEVPWHRDLAPGLTRAGWTLCVPGVELDTQTLDNGCVHVVPGSNKEEAIDIDGLLAQHGWDLPGMVPCQTKPGDILVHSGNVLHASRPTDAPTLRRTVYIGAFAIDEYMEFYEATPEYVRLQMRNMFKTIQLRQTLPYLDGEEPYVWKGSPEWKVDLEPDAFVEWDLPASYPGNAH
jgi:ectoine hydroxylase-related dioxygenase (phytanoyl-CoA dioxygenase family)